MWAVFIILSLGIIARTAFTVFRIIKSTGHDDSRRVNALSTLGRLFLPFHNAIIKRPLYASARYVFHACLIIVPIFLSGHIALWEESMFEWNWGAIPDEWADWMTLLLLGLSVYFLARHIVFKDIRQNSSGSDYILIIITALPFMTGYFLTHGTLDSVVFLKNNMWTIHILSGEAMLFMIVFLFCRINLNKEKCTGCAACELICPTGTLESIDENRLRIFTYSHYQCICCGSCVKACPDDAAELRHEISFRRFLQITPRQVIQSVELMACEQCGKVYAPEPQLDRIGKIITDEYLTICPQCRKVNYAETFYRLSPWAKKIIKINRISSIGHQ